MTAPDSCPGAFMTLVGGEHHVAAALCFKTQMVHVGTTCPVYVAVADQIKGSALLAASIRQLRQSYGPNHIIMVSDLAATAAQTRPPSPPWSASAAPRHNREGWVRQPRAEAFRDLHGHDNMSDFVSDEGGPSQHRGRRLYRVGVGKAALFFKLLLWALPPETFPRVAFIDLDVLILTNLDELLRDEHMLVAPNAIAAAPVGLACEKGSASPEHANTAFFNSGVFVFRPSLTHLHLLLLTEHHVHYPWNGYFPAMKNASWADQCSPKDDVYRFARLFNGSSNAFRDCRLHHNGSLTGRIPKACEPTLTDQSILNRVFGKRWNLLDSRFNVHRQGLLGCRFVANASEERVAEGGGAGAETSVSCKGKVVSIVHFVGEPKPWDPDRRRRSQPHGATSPTFEESAKMLYRQRCGFL